MFIQIRIKYSAGILFLCNPSGCAKLILLLFVWVFFPLKEWEDTRVGKLNICGYGHPWKEQGPWDLNCFPPKLPGPASSCQWWEMHSYRLSLIHLLLSFFFLVTDENSESDSDTEEKLKGKANVWREKMAPDKLCSELLGQDLSSVFYLWRRTLFVHRTRWARRQRSQYCRRKSMGRGL